METNSVNKMFDGIISESILGHTRDCRVKVDICFVSLHVIIFQIKVHYQSNKVHAHNKCQLDTNTTTSHYLKISKRYTI